MSLSDREGWDAVVKAVDDAYDRAVENGYKEELDRMSDSDLATDLCDYDHVLEEFGYERVLGAVALWRKLR
jgi:hypothetical protein